MNRILNRGRHVTRLTQFFRPFATEKGVETVNKPLASTPNEPPEDSIHKRMHVPSDFEKKILVWVGRFKTVDEVPRAVSEETISKAKNKARIKVCNYMMLATIVGCIFMVYSGKEAAKRGESLQKMNMDWHKAVKEGKA